MSDATGTGGHVPVMLDRVLELLAPALGGERPVVVDANLGLGGHSEALLAAHPALHLIGIDRDPFAIDFSTRRLAPYAERTTLVHASSDQLADVVATTGAALGRTTVDGVLFDLGVSSPQLDEAERGFAYSYDAPLDMRMDTEQELTAEKVVNTYSAGELTRILRDYGEERFAPRVAGLIVKERAKEAITSTKRLAEIVRQAIPAATRRTGGNPAKRTFQALRIEVNAELTALEAALPAALDALALGGRVVVLSYHSLEDRLTKQVLTARTRDTSPPGLPVPLPAHQPRFRLVTRGAELPGEEELARNPRAASARLRAAERIRVDDHD
ncbi:16S rRNA (cytosine(1402)-N(4))-methyltransferase RsmH [Nonomuraea roseoviolacea subsp. roseoviolacea]|uniref:Ribosomal RNA small subunit methyltransferase H n=1 Tax=Nonomuraea roseoviolacea subsp. carminata TaxID=160689 RepID=A0ABT1JRD4_9ACTN|nr:16S rRNA (cytosine(1402)-N(4))-methyltransferase RsmH [Nonomuraea roseoviolacea]MCP2344298.1 16S rRNA (cytosine1402-N4)-methyltransferase [Nonomuraea roseoviolacea subsp. carminata]